MEKVTLKPKFARSIKRVVIYGGLGNQLFGFALAAHLQSLGTEVQVLQARERVGNKTHGVSATRYLAFGFSGRVKALTPVSHALLSFARRSKHTAQFLRVTFTDNPDVTAKTLSTSNASWLVGYHQNFNPSQLLSLQQLALGVHFLDAPQNEEPTSSAGAGRQSYVAVHVRGGDLRYLKNTAGLLSPEYFVSAVTRLFRQYEIPPSSPISIVTDDVDLALEVYEALRKKGFKPSINDTASTSSIAAFQVLSHADYVVASNSSFSYWAAITGRPKIVAYPSPWRADGKGALPVPTFGTWTAVRSNWCQGQDLPVGSEEE